MLIVLWLALIAIRVIVILLLFLQFVVDFIAVMGTVQLCIIGWIGRLPMIARLRVLVRLPVESL